MIRHNLHCIYPLFILALLAIAAVDANAKAVDEASAWAVYYDDKLHPEELQPYNVLVLDSQYHPTLTPLTGEHRMLLGYLSLGEVESHRAHFEQMRPLHLKENKHWPGSYYLDVRDPRWAQLVLEELIPQILSQGFDGLFIDTMDNPAALERDDPVTYAGMTKAAADLMRAIRMHYPEAKVMLNRGYELIPLIGNHIDMVLGECVYADYNFETKVYSKVEPSLYKQQVDILTNAKSTFPHLDIFTLDYWDPADTEGIVDIYKTQRANGFRPYVATIDLKTVIPEPAP